MGYQELNLGRDLDEMAMAMNHRSVREQITSITRIILENFGVNKKTTSIEETVKIDLSERV